MSQRDIPAGERAAAPHLALTEAKAREWAETGEPPWPFDIGALLAEYDRRGRIAAAAEAVVADWSDSDLDDNSDHPLWNRLDALAREVGAARGSRR